MTGGLVIEVLPTYLLAIGACVRSGLVSPVIAVPPDGKEPRFPDTCATNSKLIRTRPSTTSAAWPPACQM